MHILPQETVLSSLFYIIILYLSENRSWIFVCLSVRDNIYTETDWQYFYLEENVLLTFPEIPVVAFIHTQLAPLGINSFVLIN